MIRRNLRHFPKRYPTWSVLFVLSQVGYFCEVTHLTLSDKKLVAEGGGVLRSLRNLVSIAIHPLLH